MDFERIYRITGIFANTLFTAVSFKVPRLEDVPRQSPHPSDEPDSEEDDVYKSKPPGSKPSTVWTNIRRDKHWWAELVQTPDDPDVLQEEPSRWESQHGTI